MKEIVSLGADTLQIPDHKLKTYQLKYSNDFPVDTQPLCTYISTISLFVLHIKVPTAINKLTTNDNIISKIY